MLMGALMGKRYPARKYVNVVLIVLGVALFMGGGESSGSKTANEETMSSAGQLFGIMLLFVSLCFDGGTGAYEDKLMSVYQVQPFDLMFNIQLGKTILAGIGLLVFNQLHIFIQMVRDMGFLLVALGITGAMGQVRCFLVAVASCRKAGGSSIAVFSHSCLLCFWWSFVLGIHLCDDCQIRSIDMQYYWIGPKGYDARCQHLFLRAFFKRHTNVWPHGIGGCHDIEFLGQKEGRRRWSSRLTSARATRGARKDA